MAPSSSGPAVDPACWTPELSLQGFPQHAEPSIKVVALHFADRNVILERRPSNFLLTGETEYERVRPFKHHLEIYMVPIFLERSSVQALANDQSHDLQVFKLQREDWESHVKMWCLHVPRPLYSV